ncbi:hypothetical protein IFM58399_02067 [Aspergillus lentulus]|uniref:Uncharacterized protein n=1 Tax=Aspergillus lentulus TaxID=293939 RepID=A0ABQ0ZWN1_ASPLE|nr:uncharacterized protein IFM58399_02067 [Aspergillus lentulus]GFF28719.1 hypothetical protein IFM58399_02067 [Aspergillus lentulus]GFF49507.1 hypothetical protein IFM62136_01298 [Aspergillus lentulus]GFF67232.1 hypothetical protein IFM47457_01649 [Aspergillus lentulus]GFF67341.1 hypothetical protein IFM60648_02231 [Aspergillus lentulus]GFG05394.1 hypothetical protein IFM61392_03809 [Aspergillus lentulus]
MPAISHSSTELNRTLDAPDAASDILQAICAWPVSGQYGPGTRILYYVLITTCVFGRRAEWLRNACLAAALLFPAVAALHSIVLASLHIEAAVDMDVFGAFQLCSIGILTAPVTVRLSKTYFNEPGRNIIFLWTGLILAGLLSLTIEFYRIKPHPCTVNGRPIFKNSDEFHYGTTMCNLTCSVVAGPFSPMRQGSANDIYVIPVPEKLTFGAATLLAAACCIPAILSLASMWNKILEINWTRRFGNPDRNKKQDEVIEGTNGATLGTMNKVNEMIRSFLSVVEVPIFGAAVLVIILIGEMNFFSDQVRYQTERIESIGQWAPIVGAGLAVLGSLSLFLAAAVEDQEEDVEEKASSTYSGPLPRERILSDAEGSCVQDRPNSLGSDRGSSIEVGHTMSRSSRWPLKRSATEDQGSRRKIAHTLFAVSNWMSNAAHDRYQNSDFKSGPALRFPEIPGEENRNGELNKIRKQYNRGQNTDEFGTSGSPERLSRVPSFTGSISSRRGLDGSPPIGRSSSPAPSIGGRSQASMSQADRSSFDVQDPSSSGNATGSHSRARGNTLEVPKPIYASGGRIRSSTAPNRADEESSMGDSSPIIVVSPDPGPSSPGSIPRTPP